LPNDQPSDWPLEIEVRNYNARVRAQLDAIIEDPTAAAARDPYFADGTLLQVAIEHRLMHSETLAYLMHQLPYDQKARAPMRLDISSNSPEPRIVKIPAGTATLGKPRSSSFGWDNEFDEERVGVAEFHADVFPVINAQYLEFVRAGGYDNASLWNDADWKWRHQAALQHPHYWRKSGDQWFWHAMFAEIPLPLAWPVYVSHAEASAYARWAGKKLPTESQWHRIAYGSADGNEREYPWGDALPARALGNFDFRSWDPTPVDAHPAGSSSFGVDDLVGNGWEWTSTPFAPLAGFEPFPFYPGYSANFFDGQHFVMKGGSPRTAACMLRRSFRNWFQPHYPYMYAKFRCVED
jgi:ergothioneine biosynthesis protein EgtB